MRPSPPVETADRSRISTKSRSVSSFDGLGRLLLRRRRVRRLAEAERVLGDHVAEHLEGATVDSDQRGEPVDVFGAAVVGGDVGGIRHQIKDGWNGFLVKTPDQAAARMVQLLKNPGLREQVGSRAKESVRQNFLMSRLLEDWLDLLSKYERAVV